ncbi:MAG: hypothetical protein M1838_002786 [Thelocarpon superellum]|nr:MAG: hypothetical protein M1838_002786 [Thelocarpon superellum]
MARVTDDRGRNYHAPPDSPWHMNLDLYDRLPRHMQVKVDSIQLWGDRAGHAIDAFEFMTADRHTFCPIDAPFNERAWDNYASSWRDDKTLLECHWIAMAVEALRGWENLVHWLEWDGPHDMSRRLAMRFYLWCRDCVLRTRQYTLRAQQCPEPTLERIMTERRQKREAEAAEAAEAAAQAAARAREDEAEWTEGESEASWDDW